MSKDVTSTTSCGSLLTLSTYTQVSSDQIPFENRKTVSQLLTSYEETMYCIYATICALKTEAPWWYLGCRGCAKKVTPYLNPKTEEIKMDKFCSKKKKKWIIIQQIHKSAYELLEQQVQKLKGDVSLLAEEDGQLSSTKSKPKVAHVTKDDCGKPSSTKQKSIILAMSKMKLAFTPVAQLKLYSENEI
ncbi:unnamed protein product [Brassica rapa subsp. trilocularis]